ncbi:hypothetical protein C1645_877228 [Glomus cerebriforme]|uniref:Copper acquisition factor BIM1-like domain-containing protein n=1 Tax=Glomus cerebriforme TaxID=658196 RepID=A0A397SXI8_9GLOM|nr:hypothetical protein C1645_877228 [Glomus cerebriforme]
MNILKNFAAFFVLFLVLISSANAHMKFDNPPFRGDNEDTMPQPPCGGFNDVNSTAITPFPVNEGQATTEFEDGTGILIYSYAPNSNSTFTPVSDNVQISIPDGTGPKPFTTPIDLSKAGAKVGDQGVLQAYFTDGKNMTWYQCADITVVNPLKNEASPFADTSEVTFFVIALASLIIAF